jgi:hypothetical protein
MGRCVARTVRGTRCKAAALRGGKRCMFHSARSVGVQAGVLVGGFAVKGGVSRALSGPSLD